jgi:hypothetical protein
LSGAVNERLQQEPGTEDRPRNGLFAKWMTFQEADLELFAGVKPQVSFPEGGRHKLRRIVQ